MTRSNIDPLYAFDPEIDKTLRRLRKTRTLIVNNSRSLDFVINSNQFCTDNSVASSNIFTESGGRPSQAPQGIPRSLFNNEVAGDTRGLYQNEGVPILPGWSCKRLVVSSASTLQHLGDMKRTFLEKFFPASKTVTIEKEICGIQQHIGETLHEY
ncbi:hypothetical protein CR513_10827, partial [Mucuna pruriens]